MARSGEVDLTHVEKKGDWYVVKGVKDGHHTSIDIPAHSIEGKSRRDAEALMKRGVDGNIDRERRERA